MGLPSVPAWSLLCIAARITRDNHRKVNEPVKPNIRRGVFSGIRQGDRMKISRACARRFGAGSALFALLASALALGSTEAWAQGETRIRFTLDRAIDGTTAPLFVALDRGYFKAEGLDVSIDPASSPQEALTRLALANGAAEPTHDMSMGDINTLIRYRDQNPPTGIKAVFIVHDRPAYAIVGRKSRGIQVPKDTEGRKLGAPGPDPAVQIWPLFARISNIDTSRVTLLNVGPQVRAPMLASGEVDAIIGNSFSAFVDLKDRGVLAEDIVTLLMADYGLTLYGAAILASAKFQSERPEAIRAFLRAYALGLRDTMQNPAVAVDSVLSRMQQAPRKEIELERLRIVLAQNIKKFDPKAPVVGDADQVRLGSSIVQLAITYSFKNKLKSEDIFDPQYLPAPPQAQAQPQKKKKK
jgi:NitT/TauT family transport system substrate-binding protein